MPHAARVGKDDFFEARAALFDCQQLVDLLLVLGDRKAHLGVIEDEGHLLGDRVLIDRHRHAAQSLCRGDRPIEPRPVVADDRELVAAAEPDGRQTAGERFDLGRLPAPRSRSARCRNPSRGWPAGPGAGARARAKAWERCPARLVSSMLPGAAASLRSLRVPNRRGSTGQAAYSKSKERITRTAARRAMRVRAALPRAGSTPRRWRGRTSRRHQSAPRSAAGRT